MTEFKPMPPAPAQNIQDRYVDKIATLPLGKLGVRVHVLAVKNRFGNVDALVKPIVGDGEQWVLASRLADLTDLTPPLGDFDGAPKSPTPF